jgi:hypothetical protein
MQDAKINADRAGGLLGQLNLVSGSGCIPQRSKARARGKYLY